jgi:hypothetical protein
MLIYLMLSLMCGGHLPVHEDNVPLRGDIHDFDPQVRCRLTRIRDELFHPVHPRVLWMHGRMVVVVISEILMHNIEVASHRFLISVLKKPPDKRFVFLHRHWTSSLVGQRW